MKPINKILAIETSCDETAAAVIDCAPFCEYPPHLGGGLLPASPAGGDSSEVDSGVVKNSDLDICSSFVIPHSSFPTILSNIVSSQIDLHKLTGGVVPEVAARAHLESIIPVIREALIRANTSEVGPDSCEVSGSVGIENLLTNIDAIAVTNGPGLIGALLIGFNTAKTLAYALNLPLIPINHIEGHIYSALGEVSSKSECQMSKRKNISKLDNSDLDIYSSFFIPHSSFPALALVVSGGHTSLTLMKDHGKYETIGETVDDAAGEAFDKVAKLLGLGYPGGPAVSKLASKFRNGIFKSQFSISNKAPSPNVQTNNLTIQQFSNIVFPRPMLHSDDFNFSFSGLKTAVLHKVRELSDDRQLTTDDRLMICAAFEEAVVDVLITKTLKAAKQYGIKNIIVAGGVSANQHLRSEFISRLPTTDYRLSFPPPDMTGDNAAMIGLAAAHHILCHPEPAEGSTWDKVSVDSNLRL